jgi:hypothetical protein
MNKLTFRYQQRKTRANQTPRKYLDFFIDGISLKTILNAAHFDFISPFGWGVREDEKYFIEELRLKRKPELNSGRIRLYVCPECGDINCGAITVKITKLDDMVVWSDFAVEDGTTINRNDFENIASLKFEKHQYYHSFDEIK